LLDPHLPDWRLPAGVTRGTLEYARSEIVTGGYDAEFAENTLFDFDRQVLERHFTRPGLIVDLGCGTGRLLVPFARRGFRGLAVDLSLNMLRIVGAKTRAERLPIDRLLANLVDMAAVRDAVADYCLCMFSTLGMIRGAANRQRALGHVHRLLKPGGLFIIHVHNRWSNLFVPAGRRWLWGNLLASLGRSDVEPGDKFFDYHDVPQMFLHLFTQRELKRSLERAGLSIVEWIPLDTQRRHALRCPWFFGRLRANGWIVVCRR
jgi:SAM-dependent methyltransferase